MIHRFVVVQPIFVAIEFQNEIAQEDYGIYRIDLAR
jgi:hypothetical protein